MTEPKVDEMTATGRIEPGRARQRLGRSRGHRTRAQRNWLERAQPSNPRHAAITRSLYSWTNYKNWTDKVRSNWDKDKGGQSNQPGFSRLAGVSDEAPAVSVVSASSRVAAACERTASRSAPR